jgi:hypothetical protein
VSEGGVTEGGAAEGGPTLQDAGSCGQCPTGFTCSTSGTYCVNANGVPAFDHAFVIVMENTSQKDIVNNTEAPYINQLVNTYAYTINYSTSYHPSLPNYLDLVSGTNQNISCDCAPTGVACGIACGPFSLPLCACGGMMGKHLGDQLDGAKVEWRQYAESMMTPCNAGAAAPFAAKHVPFLYFNDVSSNVSRCQQRVRDYGDFAPDLAAGTYRFSLISPDLCDDMHGDPSCKSGLSETTQGDNFLKSEVPKILAGPGFGPTGKDVLFITWDEGTGSTGGPETAVLAIIISPLAKKGPTTKAYTHESLLATIEDSFGVPRLNNAASVPSPINDVWQ